MLAVVIREITYLKVLAPIMRELQKNNVPYILYHFDAPRGNKEYNRASKSKIEKASPISTYGSKKVKAFANDQQLLQQLIHDKITKLVSIEIWLWAKGYVYKLKANNIKTYSILYLTDSLWEKNPACVTSLDKVYYSTEYLMAVQHSFAGIKFDPVRDKCLGSPVTTPAIKSDPESKDILVLLPNLRKEHIGVSFGSTDRFVRLMEKLTKGGNLIFKTRKKQWVPNEIYQFAKEIIDDGDIMDPPIIYGLLKKCYATVMFYSSGIYECIYSGHHVYNIPLPLERWGWNKEQLVKYFSTDEGCVYNFPGAVEDVSQDLLLGDWEFKPIVGDFSAKQQWLDKFGTNENEAARKITEDIINS